MERIAERDLDKIRAFLVETSAPCDLSGFSARILPAIQDLVPGDVICLSESDQSQQKSVTFDVYPAGSHIDPQLFDLFMFDHPVFQYWDRLGECPAAFTSDVVRMREWHRTELYQNVYRPLGLEDSLAFGLPASPGFVSCICIERARRFTGYERVLMDTIRPYVAQLYRNAELFSLLGRSAGGAAHAMVLDSAGRPLLAPNEAWELIDRYFPATVEAADVFPPPLSRWLRGQLARTSLDHEVPPPPSPLTIGEADGGTLTLRLIPGSRTGEQALLLFHETRQPFEAVAPDLGLSQREQDVLVLARRGLRNADIAERLQISRRTVEKHFDNIYSKLGVANRTAAIDRAFRYAVT